MQEPAGGKLRLDEPAPHVTRLTIDNGPVRRGGRCDRRAPVHGGDRVDADPYPVVAALNGHAISGGLVLALSCDLRICSADARLGMPPARLGLVYSHTGVALRAACFESDDFFEGVRAFAQKRAPRWQGR